MMNDLVATLEIRAGRDDLCKQYWAERRGRTRQTLMMGEAADLYLQHQEWAADHELEPTGKISFSYL